MQKKRKRKRKRKKKRKRIEERNGKARIRSEEARDVSRKWEEKREKRN